jgi:hypothetical protein
MVAEFGLHRRANRRALDATNELANDTRTAQDENDTLF